MKNMRIKSVLTLLVLTLSVGLNAKTVKLNEYFCEPTTFLVGCEAFTEAGDYTIEVTPDSTVMLHLAFGPVPATQISASIAKGDRFLFGCNAYTEEGTYSETFTSIHGCDSIVYLNLSFDRCDTAFSESAITLCQKELPYTYHGAKEYVIYNDTTFLDTIIGGAATGCDSIATVHVTIHRFISEQIKEQTTICEGSVLEWHGKRITAEGVYFDTVRYITSGCDSAAYELTVGLKHVTMAMPVDSSICEGGAVEWRGKMYSATGSYYDTIPYTTGGCDSIIYTLNLTVNPIQRTGVNDTLCLLDAKLKYPRLNIKGTGIYYDTLQSVTKCDSIVKFDIVILSKSVLPELNEIADLMPVVCGYALNTTDLLAAANLAALNQPAGKAMVKEMWVEMQLTPTSLYEKIVDQAVSAAVNKIAIRLVAVSECGDTTVGKPIDRYVETPSPENNKQLDKMPAVSKYNNWLLMIHYNKISQMGFSVAEEDVTWYQVVGEQDPTDAIVDDKMVGTGYYYTADKSLTNSYYAILEDHSNECGARLRTLVLECSAASRMDLAPVSLRRGDNMTLSSLNPDEATQIAIYDMNGKLIKQMNMQGAESYQISADQHIGMYMLRAVNGEQEDTFRFIITQ